MMRLVSAWPRLSRNTKGSIYVELVVAMILLTGLFIGTALIGMKTIDFDRDARATRAAIDVMHVMDSEGGPADQSDFDIIGQKVVETNRLDPREAFDMHFTAVEFFEDPGNGIAEPRIAWSGSYGTGGAYPSRVSLGPTLVTVNGYDLDVAPGERLLVAEITRSRRGMVIDEADPVYTYAVSYRIP